MEPCAKAASPSVQIDLTLSDDDIDMSPGPISRISEDKRKEIRNICKSGFGSEFMREHSESEHVNFSTLLDMLRRNQFASVEEVKQEAICFLDAQVSWFQNPDNVLCKGTHQRSEMIVMAENLKQRFIDLEDESNAEERRTQYVMERSTKNVIVEKLREIFPHLHHSELPLIVNHYLVESVNNSVKEIDIGFAVNEISQQILNTENDLDGPSTSVDQQG